MIQLLPNPDNGVFLTYTGMETDLIYNKGLDLPGFAAHPLLASREGQDWLRHYYDSLIALAREAGTGCILEAPTWAANRDRGREIHCSETVLHRRNQEALELLADIRRKHHRHQRTPTILLSANIGPRYDGYAPDHQMTADEAESYHRPQIQSFATTEADLITAYTLTNAPEAIGILNAASATALPVVISFTVETDGHLPDGQPLAEAIATVDEATDRAACYFMVNCAHPSHFSNVLDRRPWMQRVHGIVANASRCSHAELEAAETLDDGDPAELARLLQALHHEHPQLTVLGGCCGTDLRHLQAIAQRLPPQSSQ